MADDEERQTGEETTTGTETGSETGSESTSQTETPADDLARLREENARLSGEVAALRTPPKPADKGARRLEDLTPVEIEQTATEIAGQIDAGTLSASQGARALARLEALRLDQERHQRETANRPVRRAQERVAEYIGRYADLAQAGSELHGKVIAELRGVMEDFGFAADDPRAHVLAIERVVGGHKLGGGMDDRERMRRRVPVGGAGPGGGGPETETGKKPDPVKEVERLYPDQMVYWKNMNYSAADMAAEAPLVLSRRGARRLRTA